MLLFGGRSEKRCDRRLVPQGSAEGAMSTTIYPVLVTLGKSGTKTTVRRTNPAIARPDHVLPVLEGINDSDRIIVVHFGLAFE